MRCEPALRLHLRGGAGARRPFGEKYHLPAEVGGDSREARERARLELFEGFPETFDRFDVAPQPARLTAGELDAVGRRRRVGFHDVAIAVDVRDGRVWCRRG